MTDREKALAYFRHREAQIPMPGARAMYQEAIKALEQPTIEPQRKKGKWQVTDAYPHNVYCSECHKKFAQTHWAVREDGSLPRNFCPNCGAKMEVDKTDGAS